MALAVVFIEYDQRLQHVLLSLVDELMGRMLSETRQEAGPLRVAILTVAERLLRCRHFDAKALADIWTEMKPAS